MLDTVTNTLVLRICLIVGASNVLVEFLHCLEVNSLVVRGTELGRSSKLNLTQADHVRGYRVSDVGLAANDSDQG